MVMLRKAGWYTRTRYEIPLFPITILLLSSSRNLFSFIHNGQCVHGSDQCNTKNIGRGLLIFAPFTSTFHRIFHSTSCLHSKFIFIIAESSWGFSPYIFGVCVCVCNVCKHRSTWFICSSVQHLSDLSVSNFYKSEMLVMHVNFSAYNIQLDSVLWSPSKVAYVCPRPRN